MHVKNSGTQEACHIAFLEKNCNILNRQENSAGLTLGHFQQTAVQNCLMEYTSDYAKKTCRRLHIYNVGQQIVRYRTTENRAHPESFAILMSGLELSYAD